MILSFYVKVISSKIYILVQKMKYFFVSYLNIILVQNNEKVEGQHRFIVSQNHNLSSQWQRQPEKCLLLARKGITTYQI